jgi:hypothetical protein
VILIGGFLAAATTPRMAGWGCTSSVSRPA